MSSRLVENGELSSIFLIKKDPEEPSTRKSPSGEAVDSFLKSSRRYASGVLFRWSILIVSPSSAFLSHLENCV